MLDLLSVGDFSLALIIGIGVFLEALALIVIYIVRRSKNREEHVVRPSFESINPLAEPGAPVLERKEPTIQDPTPGRGRRFAFGGIILSVFSILALKLWSLQIANFKTYQNQAVQNMTSEVSTPARRGRILDCKGKILAANDPTIIIKASKQIADDRMLIQKLSLVFGIPVDLIRRKLRDDTLSSAAEREIARDVPAQAIAFIKEHRAMFPGVSIESTTARVYPQGEAAAHILGYTGAVTQAELDSSAGSNLVYESGDIVGKDGIELAYESVLQGIRGTKTYHVDVEGNPLGVVSEALPVPGNDVILTLDLDLQNAADEILADAIVTAQVKAKDAKAGALVVLDVQSMGLLASASYPTFNPEDLSGGISTELWEKLTNAKSAYPLTNRVITGLYPAASTFKAFTGLAGLEHGIVQSGTYHTCEGTWYWPSDGDTKWGKKCWKKEGHGSLGLEEAINHSCDVYFYNIGASFFKRWDDKKIKEYRDNQLQDYLRSWGFGSPTGIDLPGEAQGRVPDAEWKQRAFADTPEEAQWQGGDVTNIIIGQGDILVTPLQIARGYASLARRELGTPHVFAKATDPNGNTVVEYNNDAVVSQPVFKRANVNRIEDGLRRVAERLDIFGGLEVTVACKTGTGEIGDKDPYIWFAAYAPADKPKYCVTCVIEHAANHSTVASQAVLRMLEKIYKVKNTTSGSQKQINER